MSTQRFPVPSGLPGIEGLRPFCDWSREGGWFDDRVGERHAFRWSLEPKGADPCLTVEVDGGLSLGTFKPWPAPHQAFWSAAGMMVTPQGRGIGPALYAVARDVLARIGASVAPSDNLFPGGAALWRRLDPAIKFEEQPDMAGYFRPRL